MRYSTIKPGTFYCFSPPVMIATFVIEITLAVYTIVRYKLNPVTRLASAVLVCLAIFQLAEFNICEGAFGISNDAWARIGFVAITLLPALGIHLATKLAGQKQSLLVGAAYASAATFGGFFLFTSYGVTGPACMGNYVIFSIAKGAGLAYGAYYYLFLLVAVIYAWQSAKRVGVHYPSKARALNALAVGYLAFMVPTTAANIANPSMISAIPSIMCGFAVILALVLAGEVLPQYFSDRSFVGALRNKTQNVFRI